VPHDNHDADSQPAGDVTELSPRVGPLDAVRHALTLAWRSLAQIKHNPMELMDLTLQPLMFVLLFAFVFGGAMMGSPKAFLQFGLAGIIVQNALFLTMNTAVGLNTDIGKGVLDRFRSLPIARSAPLAGRIAADVVRQVWSAAIKVNPVTLLTDAMRGLLVRGGVVRPTVAALTWGVAIAAVSAPLALRAFRRRS